MMMLVDYCTLPSGRQPAKDYVKSLEKIEKQDHAFD